VRRLIRTMSEANPLWGAPRLHGELLKLGVDIGETSVSKYMARHPKPPSQTWRTLLENHLRDLVSVDFFIVPTIRFQVLYVFLVLAHDRRRIIHVNVTAHPTAEWTAQQLRDAFPWNTVPRYRLIWKILHQGTRYEERGPAVTKTSQQVRTRKMIRELRRLGYGVELVSAPSGSPA
jgi:putative transposase